MEQLLPVIETHCTFPMLEKLKLFRRVLFCFLTGNEDMHLKNFSLIVKGDMVQLSPAYDLLNTTIAIKNAEEEFALPLSGKKRRIDAKLLLDYYGSERMGLTNDAIQKEVHNLLDGRSVMQDLINISFLSKSMKAAYQELLAERYQTLVG